MTQKEKLVKIILPDLLIYLRKKKSGEILQKRLDNREIPSIHCNEQEFYLGDNNADCNANS